MSAPEGMNMADMGAVQRALLSLSARVKTLEGAVARLSDQSAHPSPAFVAPVDPNMPSEGEMKAMRERLRKSHAEGIEANKIDPTRAGRTYRRESGESVFRNGSEGVS